MTPAIAPLDVAQLANALPFVIAITALLWTLRVSIRPRSSGAVLFACLACASASLVLSDAACWTLLGVAVLCALRLPRPEREASANSRILPLLGFSIVAYLAARHLGSYSTTPLVWEGASLNGLLDELDGGGITAGFIRRTFWTQGALSKSNDSLIYGFPTLILLSISSSLTALRTTSVVCLLGSIGALSQLSRRFLNQSTATAAIFVLGLNELALFFGRYGGAISAMNFCLAASLYSCALLVERPTIPRSILSVLTLYLATLTYAPARYIAMLLTLCSVVGLTRHTSLSRKEKTAALSWFVAFLALPCLYQASSGNFPKILAARDEHLLGMFHSGEWPEGLKPEWQTFSDEHRGPGARDYLYFAKLLLSKETSGQLATLLSPYKVEQSALHHYDMDPLFHSLYAPALFPFLLVGLVSVAQSRNRWLHYTLLTWAGSASILLLFTSRVDAYRGTVLMIPVVLWISAGIARTMDELHKRRFPTSITSALLFITIALGTYSAYRFTADDTKPSQPEVAVLETLPASIVNGAIIGVAPGDFRTFGFMKLTINARKQQGESAPSRALLPDEYHALRAPLEAAGGAVIEALAREISPSHQLVLGPIDDFNITLQILSDRGFRASTATTPQMTVAIVSK